MVGEGAESNARAIFRVTISRVATDREETKMTYQRHWNEEQRAGVAPGKEEAGEEVSFPAHDRFERLMAGVGAAVHRLDALGAPSSAVGQLNQWWAEVIMAGILLSPEQMETAERLNLDGLPLVDAIRMAARL